MLTFSGYKAFSFHLFSSPLLNKSGQALASAIGYMGDQWPPLEWLRYLLGKKQDRNYTTFKPRPQNEVCHKKYNFVYFTLLFRTAFTAQPQETGTLYHTTSGALTVQFAISRNNFLITPCISLSLFMMSTPLPRPIRVCVSIATLLGHWPAAPSNLLLMFAPILFVISVSIVSTRALSLLLALVLSILLFFVIFWTS